MQNPIERNMGMQPLAKVMDELSLKPRDLTSASTEQITHKMVNRAMKGRRLTPHVQQKIVNALNNATHKHFAVNDLFNY
jgi:hypothetical protein